VTFPLSRPASLPACCCAHPIVGEFVIPDLLAGSNSLMIGQTLWLEFFTNKDWPVASAVATCCWPCCSPRCCSTSACSVGQLEAR